MSVLEAPRSAILTRSARFQVSRGMSTILGALVMLFIISAIFAPSSVSKGAVLGMLPFAAVLAIIGLGQTLVVQQGGIDLLFESKSADKGKGGKINISPKVSRATFDAPADAWDSSGAKISFVNPNNRSVIVMNSGVRWERLAATLDNSVNFMEIVYDAGSESNDGGELLVHDGYEYGFALDGEIEVTVGDLVQTISKGDSIGFDSTFPHMFRNISNAPFRGIWFVHGCADPHR